METTGEGLSSEKTVDNYSEGSIMYRGLLSNMKFK